MHAYEIGLCSWNLHLVDEPALRPAMERFGLRVVHLALLPLAEMPEEKLRVAVEQFRGSPLKISAGMIAFPGEDYTNLETIHATGGLVPDATYEARNAIALKCGRIARELGVKLVSTHAGFIPTRGDAAAFAKLQLRLGKLADEYAKMGLELLFETGQEDAATLKEFLTALGRPNVGVNFDPANMLLYGKGDPVAAVLSLGGLIKHAHAKDTLLHVPPPADAKAWRGHEIPLGQGDARLKEVIGALRKIGYGGPLAIEREAGEKRTQDILEGIAFLKKAIAETAVG